jgi:hypothetical protein
MRDPKRIPIVLKHLDKFLYSFNIDYEKINKKQLKLYWTNNPDLRLTQALINLNMISDGWYWIVEEVDFLIMEEILKFEEIHFWGNNYDEKGKKLRKTKWILLKDLDISHIENILKYFDENSLDLNEEYKKYFLKRIKLEKRKKEKRS